MERELFNVLSFFAFWLGACIASFLNVVIWRVPRGESIVSPPSHCPKCGALIRWYQNLPIVAWLALRGRCAKCREPISPRYILIETLGGLLFLAVFRTFCSPAALVSLPILFNVLVLWIWIALMIVGTFIDFDHQLLPDFVTVGGMILGLVWAGEQSFVTRDWTPVLVALAGLAVGFGVLYLVRAVGTKVFKREAMGMGDVLLLGAVGALFGPVAAIFTLVLSSFYGSLVGLSLCALSRLRLGGGAAIPYGPYICMACLTWIFYGPQLLDWYLQLLRFG